MTVNQYRITGVDRARECVDRQSAVVLGGGAGDAGNCRKRERGDRGYEHGEAKTHEAPFPAW
jgi:hypothetical protein